MQDLNKEFRHFMEDNEKPTNHTGRKVYITKTEPIPTIGTDGNITTTESNTYCLAMNVYNADYRISKDYYGIKHIIGDFYTVMNYKVMINPPSREKQINQKFGIIKLKRNIHFERGFINENETIIAPIIYDQIYVYDCLYPIIEVNNNYTYFCIDEQSKNYGKQLLPAVLEAACPFNIKYEGFAECIIDGVTRFIPIDFIATEKITKDDLLTEEEVISLISSYEIFEKINKTTSSEIPQLIKKLKK